MERPNAWKRYNEEQLKQLEALCGDYRKFLDEGKTERECVKLTVSMAEAAGYKNLADVIREKQTLKAGDKVYANCMDKTAILFHL